MNTRHTSKKESGFALFAAIVIGGTLLVVVTGIVTLAVRQSFIAQSGQESQYAFYAADSALECALYWDVHNPSGSSAFDPSTGSQVTCNYTPSNTGNSWVVGGNNVSTFGPITFLPNPYCATVTVTKDGDTTLIESRGYNTCDTSSPRRVERAVRATY